LALFKGLTQDFGNGYICMDRGQTLSSLLIIMVFSIALSVLACWCCCGRKLESSPVMDFAGLQELRNENFSSDSANTTPGTTPHTNRSSSNANAKCGTSSAAAAPVLNTSTIDHEVLTNQSALGYQPEPTNSSITTIEADQETQRQPQQQSEQEHQEQVKEETEDQEQQLEEEKQTEKQEDQAQQLQEEEQTKEQEDQGQHLLEEEQTEQEDQDPKLVETEQQPERKEVEEIEVKKVKQNPRLGQPDKGKTEQQGQIFEEPQQLQQESTSTSRHSSTETNISSSPECVQSQEQYQGTAANLVQFKFKTSPEPTNSNEKKPSLKVPSFKSRLLAPKVVFQSERSPTNGVSAVVNYNTRRTSFSNSSTSEEDGVSISKKSVKEEGSSEKSVPEQDDSSILKKSMSEQEKIHHLTGLEIGIDLVQPVRERTVDQQLADQADESATSSQEQSAQIQGIDSAIQETKPSIQKGTDCQKAHLDTEESNCPENDQMVKLCENMHEQTSNVRISAPETSAQQRKTTQQKSLICKAPAPPSYTPPANVSPVKMRRRTVAPSSRLDDPEPQQMQCGKACGIKDKVLKVLPPSTPDEATNEQVKQITKRLSRSSSRSPLSQNMNAINVGSLPSSEIAHDHLNESELVAPQHNPSPSPQADELLRKYLEMSKKEQQRCSSTSPSASPTSELCDSSIRSSSPAYNHNSLPHSTKTWVSTPTFDSQGLFKPKEIVDLQSPSFQSLAGMVDSSMDHIASFTSTPHKIEDFNSDSSNDDLVFIEGSEENMIFSSKKAKHEEREIIRRLSLTNSVNCGPGHTKLLCASPATYPMSGEESADDLEGMFDANDRLYPSPLKALRST